MERETAGCLFLNKNSITSINLLLSLNYLNFIINNNITACSILLYIPESEGILQVLMNEQGMEKIPTVMLHLVPGSFLEILVHAGIDSLATMSGQILFICFLYGKIRDLPWDNNQCVIWLGKQGSEVLNKDQNPSVVIANLLSYQQPPYHC